MEGRVDDESGPIRAYYEAKARDRRRGPLRGRRLDLREDFIALLRSEGRGRLLDAGAGPGWDLAGFVEAGIAAVGVDLAVGNGRLAAESGLTVVAGSVTALPVRPGGFDAGWSVSTLMHLDAGAAGRAVDQLVTALAPSSPVLIGTWGRESEGRVVDDGLGGQRRTFWLRSRATNRAMLAARATIEDEEWWPDAADGEDYQVFRLRTPS
jgi:SAM-dependent methyltransferase